MKNCIIANLHIRTHNNSFPYEMLLPTLHRGIFSSQTIHIGTTNLSHKYTILYIYYRVSKNLRNPEIAETYIKPFGTLFLNLIKSIVVQIVLQSVGLPIEEIALIAGVDRIFEMGNKTVTTNLNKTMQICREV